MSLLQAGYAAFVTKEFVCLMTDVAALVDFHFRPTPSAQIRSHDTGASKNNLKHLEVRIA